jgi:MYXO-CTERM domain-containing protein
MAQKRGSQRGLVKTATAAILAAFGALLSMTGCSADQGSGGGEHLGRVSQALTCSKVNPTCPDTACGTWSCDIVNQVCVLKNPPPAPDGTKCADAQNNVGACSAGFCCTGCLQRVANGYQCHPLGTELGFCGDGGQSCQNCDTGNSCAKDQCYKFSCLSDPLGDNTACPGGQCWSGQCCTGCLDDNKACQPGNATTSCGKSSVNGLVGCKDCTDGEPTCTSDSCDVKGNCVNAQVADNTSCPDGDKCNGNEVCKTGKCTGPANFSCDDSNLCTADSCDAQNGCGHQKLTGTSCADANKCNGDEVCNAGACAAGTALDCNDNNPCTADSCSAVNGCINTKQNGTSCADANKCNGAEMCVTGSCTAGTPLNCDDNNPCTADSCDPAGGCMHSAVSAGTKCDDGNVCNGISTCVGTVCSAGTALSCDDGNVCTDDSCVPATGCKFVNNVVDCSDNDLCTTNDKCSAGSCKGGAVPNCDDNEACTSDSCDSAKGCQHAAVTDGGNCDDGNDCSTGDKCVAGKCKASGGTACDDAKPCTQNNCDPASQPQACVYPNETNGTPCTFDKCHQNSTCQTGACSQGDPVDCDDANPCTTDTCDAVTGCKHVADNAAVCSDGDLCTNADHCKSGVCLGTDVVCAPLDECHEAGTCNANSGVCDDPRAMDDKPCKGGHCQTGKCIPDPIGAGGAGGETGVGGDGTAGSLTQGGAPVMTGDAGQGNEPPVTGGDTGMPTETGGVTGNGGKSSAGTTNNDGGVAEVPDHVFVRDPGGCSCSVPASNDSRGLAWLGALALAGLVAGRRRGPGSRGPANERKLD